MRKLGLLVSLGAVTLTLVGCGGGRPGDRRDDSVIVQQRADGTHVAVRPGRDPNGAYIQATELKAKGDCTNAIALLRPVARLGPGYENAQTALGECLLLQAGTNDEGVTWLNRAADAGWPEAQAQMALYYGGESAARNPSEAAYWLALYDSNPSKARIGFRAVDPARITAVRDSLSEAEKTAGIKRAATWERKLWIPPPSQNGPGLKPEGRERGSMLQPR